jgi:hypothetical protein
MIQVDSITRDITQAATAVTISMELDGKQVSREINFQEIKISPMLGATLTVIRTLNEMEKSLRGSK